MHCITYIQAFDGLGCCLFWGSGSVVNPLFIAACGLFVFGHCFVMQHFVSFLGLQSSCQEREIWLTLIMLCCRLGVCVLCLFLMEPYAGLWSVTGTFSSYTHSLFELHCIWILKVWKPVRHIMSGHLQSIKPTQNPTENPHFEQYKLQSNSAVLR